MKPELRTSLSQQLSLTPQLRQAIRLLQLSAIELEREIATAIEENPLLERVEESDDASEVGDDQNVGAESNIAIEEPAATTIDAQESPLDYEPEWDETRSSGNPDSDFDPAANATADEDLHDHLLWQLHLSPMSARDRRIGVALIEAIDHDGYLPDPVGAAQAALLPEIDASAEEIRAVLYRIQRFDPVGVGARDLRECLDVQLSVLSTDTEGLALARCIVSRHLNDLARLGTQGLATLLAAPADAVQVAVDLIRSLDPKPGACLQPERTEYVNPDCVAWRELGVWRVALSRGRPNLAINRHYEQMIAVATREDASYLRGHLQEARWLIKALETRADTVLRVARAIVRHQSGFLDHGPEAMRPLTLREIAEELELHESTVSRATTRKYLRTPRGTFEFKHFFSSKVADASGMATSSTAIQAMIRRLIDAEDPRKPLSDARIAAELKSQGVPVARRTVAKYREAMHIAASNERQRPD